MKYFLFALLIIGSFTCKAQTNIISQLSLPGGYMYLPGVQEYGNSYYIQSATEKNVVLYPFYPWLKPVQFYLSKVDASTHNILSTVVTYGDTVQADSTVTEFLFQVTDGKVHLAYVKRIVHDTFSLPTFKQHWWALYYKQLDTNLNVTVPERKLKLVGYDERLSGLYLQNLQVDHNVRIAFWQEDTAIHAPNHISKFIQLDMAGNIVKEDSIGQPDVSPQNPYHMVREINSYPGNKYLVSGINLYNVPNVFMMFYLADSAMNMIDTFALKPSSFYNPPDNSGYFTGYPNMVALPTGSIIGSGAYAHGPAGQTHTGLIKCSPGNRFAINKLVSFKGIDALDGMHSGSPSIHNLVYSKHDNRIYYADVTHSYPAGPCIADENYVQVICLDTNLNVNWKKYILVGQNACARVGFVEECDKRPGVLIAGGSSNTTDWLNPALMIDFLYHLDSTVVAGVEDPSGTSLLDRLSVYPNPAKKFIRIKDIFNEPGEAYLYNLQGSLVERYTYSTTLDELPLDEDLHGLYLLRVVTNDNENATFRIMKQ